MLQTLLLQILIILLAARLCGFLLARLGQPQVIGEMLAGILLGPTLLGKLHNGDYLAALFPDSSKPPLELLSQLGVILFMFLVGLELDLAHVLKHGKLVLHTALGSMLLPFLLGLALAFILLSAGFGPAPDGTRPGFILFIATALAITAFPVLARILTETQLTRTRAGTLAIACAALNDIAGWCLLAVALAVAKSSTGSTALHAAQTLALTLAFILIMLFIVRPLVRKRILRLPETFILLVAASLASDYIGIHAIFGAFLLGAVMPSEPQFVQQLSQKLESVSTLLLLPLFFAYTGLHTDLALLNSLSAWSFAALVTAVAIFGKVAGAYFPARLAGLPAPEALTLGILLNTRGLMELVLLNLALEAHAITPPVFSMFVIMTLLTTLMTTPLVRRHTLIPATIPA